MSTSAPVRVLTCDDLPSLRNAISTLRDLLALPRDAEAIAGKVFDRWDANNTHQMPGRPDFPGYLHAVVDAVFDAMTPGGTHFRHECPEIADSDIGNELKIALLDLRAPLQSVIFQSQLVKSSGERVRMIGELDRVLLLFPGRRVHQKKAGTKASLGRPGPERQKDIIATIVGEGTPLTEKEIMVAMGSKKRGTLPRNLSWMEKNGILRRVGREGYWPIGHDLAGE